MYMYVSRYERLKAHGRLLSAHLTMRVLARLKHKLPSLPNEFYHAALFPPTPSPTPHSAPSSAPSVGPLAASQPQAQSGGSCESQGEGEGDDRES